MAVPYCKTKYKTQIENHLQVNPLTLFPRVSETCFTPGNNLKLCVKIRKLGYIQIRHHYPRLRAMEPIMELDNSSSKGRCVCPGQRHWLWLNGYWKQSVGTPRKGAKSAIKLISKHPDCCQTTGWTLNFLFL